MTREIDSSAFEADVSTCTFTAGRIQGAGTSDAAHFSDALGRIYVTARALLLSPRPPAGQTQPALTLIVEDSADGASWATVATFTFTASDQQAAAIDSPRAYLRASWTGVVGVWAVDVDVKSLAAPSSGGGGSLPTPWTDGGHGDVGVTVDDATKTALTLIADGDQSVPLLRVTDENGDEILALGGDPFAVGRQGPITITARGGSAGNIPLNVLNEDGNNVFSVDADGVTQLTGHADPADTSAATFSIVKPPLAHPFTKLLEIADAGGDKLFQVDAEGHLISGAITDPSDNLGPSQFSIFLDPTPGATKLHIVALDSGGTPRSAVINLS